jgi:hypothetical protein
MTVQKPSGSGRRCIRTANRHWMPGGTPNTGNTCQSSQFAADFRTATRQLLPVGTRHRSACSPREVAGQSGGLVSVVDVRKYLFRARIPSTPTQIPMTRSANNSAYNKRGSIETVEIISLFWPTRIHRVCLNGQYFRDALVQPLRSHLNVGVFVADVVVEAQHCLVA